MAGLDREGKALAAGLGTVNLIIWSAVIALWPKIHGGGSVPAWIMPTVGVVAMIVGIAVGARVKRGPADEDS